MGALGTGNRTVFTYAQLPGSGKGYYENICSENLKKALNWKSTACFGCAIMCHKKARWKSYEMEGPGYEKVAWLGANCGLNDPEAEAYVNYLADDLGMDSISTGTILAFTMKAFEKGIITEADTGGIQLTFGSSEAVHEMIKKIARREGLEDKLAECSPDTSPDVSDENVNPRINENYNGTDIVLSPEPGVMIKAVKEFIPLPGVSWTMPVTRMGSGPGTSPFKIPEAYPAAVLPSPQISSPIYQYIKNK